MVSYSGGAVAGEVKKLSDFENSKSTRVRIRMENFSLKFEVPDPQLTHNLYISYFFVAKIAEIIIKVLLTILPLVQKKSCEELTT